MRFLLLPACSRTAVGTIHLSRGYFRRRSPKRGPLPPYFNPISPQASANFAVQMSLTL